LIANKIVGHLSKERRCFGLAAQRINAAGDQGAIFLGLGSRIGEGDIARGSQPGFASAARNRET
jgi:hypothetical protein